jgi:4a-hydroxytetrahydrobiopterin dehydratase
MTLPPDDLAAALAERPAWSGDTTGIARTVSAPDFPTAIRLVAAVADAAEAANHHPDIDIRWRRVTFRLSSHDVGGVSARDLALAAEIDRLAAEHDAS